MILANGTKVFLTGGHYVDVATWVGTILAHRNSTRDGDSYIIEFGHPVGKVQIKAKFVREALTEVEPTEVSPSKHHLEGLWVIAPRGIKIFEESEAKESFLVLSRHNNQKRVLITLVYEDYGTTVANIVFQGQYAVVPLNSLITDDVSTHGGHA